MSTRGARWQGIANRKLKRYGSARTITLRRWLEVPDPTASTPGTRTLAAELADVPVVVGKFTRGEHGGSRYGREKLMLSGSAIGAAPAVDGSWVAQLDNEDRAKKMSGPLELIAPDGVAVMWVGMREEGAGDGGA